LGKRIKKNEYLNREDVNLLAENILLLESNGLQKLNSKLLSYARNMDDFLTEHTYASELIRHHGWKVSIEYEPQIGKNTDFVVRYEDYPDKLFNIQIKNSSPTERENRRDKILNIIKKQLKEVKYPRFYNFSMHEDFESSHIPDFVMFIKGNLDTPDHKVLDYKINGELMANVSYSKPNNQEIDCMLPGIRGDLNPVNVTGEERDHFYRSLVKAANSFTLSTI